MKNLTPVEEIVEIIAEYGKGRLALHCEMRERVTQDRNQAYTRLVDGIEGMITYTGGGSVNEKDRRINKQDLLEKVVKPLYGKGIDMNNPKVGDVKIIKPSIDSSQDTLNELLLTLVDGEAKGINDSEIPNHFRTCPKASVKPEKTLEAKFREYLFEDDPETVSDEAKHLAQIAEEHYESEYYKELKK